MEITPEKGIRFDSGKVRHDLLSPTAINELAKVLTFGAEKYAANNWRKGMAWSRVIGSLERHLNAIKRGEDVDKETGLLHAAHVMCNAMFLADYYKIYPQGDDRPHTYMEVPRIGLDIDEVLCDFTAGWASIFGVDARPTSWNYHREMSKHFKEMKESKTLEDFYLNLKPKIDPKDIPFEPTCYVTSRSISSEITEKWLDMHNFPGTPVLTVGVGESKIEALKSAKIDIFVDDRYENFIDLNKAGICCFLYDAPHNQRYDVGYKRIKSLKELI